MDEKKFEELLLKNNAILINQFNQKFSATDERLDTMEKRFDSLENRFDSMENRLDEMENKFDKKFAEMEQKRIDDNFYFEHTYGEKIAIIFDKIKLMDDLKEIDNDKTKKMEKKIEYNSSKLMSHDFRISRLEENFQS